MKIAKKVLAIAIAVGMIFCLTAMAFANDGFDCEVKAGAVEGGKFTCTFIVKNAAGWQGTQVPVTYDKDVLSVNKLTGAKVGSWNDAYTAVGMNNLVAFNANEAGTVIPGITTAEAILSDADYAALCAEAEVDVDTSFTAAALALFTVTFKVTDENATKTTITWGDASVEVTLKAEPVTEAPKPTEPATEAPKPTEPATEKPTEAPTEVKPTEAPATEATTAATGTDAPTTAPSGNGNAAHGTVNTGDNAALAVAGAVCALAAAAFVVTKKH